MRTGQSETLRDALQESDDAGGAFAIREVNGQAILVVGEMTLVETVTPGVLAGRREYAGPR